MRWARCDAPAHTLLSYHGKILQGDCCCWRSVDFAELLRALLLTLHRSLFQSSRRLGRNRPKVIVKDDRPDQMSRPGRVGYY